MEVLTQLLGSGSSVLIAASAQPLRNLLHKGIYWSKIQVLKYHFTDLCQDFDENQRAFCHTGGMQIVKTILSAYPPPSEEILLWSTSILHVLSIHNAIIRRIIAAAGILPPLVALLAAASTSDQIQEQILKVLVNLSLTPETENAFIAAHALLPLVDILLFPRTSASLRQLALSTLANLSCNTEIRSTLCYTGLSVGLVDLLNGHSHGPDIEEAVAIVIANIAIDEILRLELLEVGAQSLMARLSCSPYLPVRSAAQAAAANISIPVDPSAKGLQTLIDSVFDTNPQDDIYTTYEDEMVMIPLPEEATSIVTKPTRPLSQGPITQKPTQAPLQHDSQPTIKPATPSPFMKRPTSHQEPQIPDPSPLISSPNPPLTPSTLPAEIHKPTAVVPSTPQEPPTAGVQPADPRSRAVTTTKPAVLRRDRIAKEILDTEQSYVKSLGVCIKVYLNPLVVNPPIPPILMPEDVGSVFLNIQRIFRINCEFLKKLKARMARGEDVILGDLFLWLWNETKMLTEYTYFINNFNTSQLKTEELCSKTQRFREYLEKCQFTEASRNLNLASFMIQPVQRVPRYILLLQDLVRHTPEDHSDYSNLRKGLERTQQAADTLNEAKRTSDSQAKIAKLHGALIGTPEGFALVRGATTSDPPRCLIREGSVLEVSKKGGSKYCYLFLFDDVLLFTRQQKAKYHFQKMAMLAELKVVDIPQNETGQHSFYLLWSSKQDKQENEVTVTCPKPEEKEYWMSCIREAVTAIKKTRFTKSTT